MECVNTSRNTKHVRFLDSSRRAVASEMTFIGPPNSDDVDYSLLNDLVPHVFKNSRHMIVFGHRHGTGFNSVVSLLFISEEFKLVEHYTCTLESRVDQLLMLPCETMFILCGFDDDDKPIVLLYQLDLNNQNSSFSEVSQVSIKSCGSKYNDIHVEQFICSYLLFGSKVLLFTSAKHLISLEIKQSKLKFVKDLCLSSEFPHFLHVSEYPKPVCQSGPEQLLFVTTKLPFTNPQCGSHIFEYDLQKDDIIEHKFLDLSSMDPKNQGRRVKFEISIFRVYALKNNKNNSSNNNNNNNNNNKINVEMYVAFVTFHWKNAVIYSLVRNQCSNKIEVQSQWHLSQLCHDYDTVVDFDCAEDSGYCHALLVHDTGAQSFILFHITDPHRTLYYISLNNIDITCHFVKLIVNYSKREALLFTEERVMMKYEFPLAEFSLKCFCRKAINMNYDNELISRLDIPRDLKRYLYRL